MGIQVGRRRFKRSSTLCDLPDFFQPPRFWCDWALFSFSFSIFTLLLFSRFRFFFHPLGQQAPCFMEFSSIQDSSAARGRL